MTNDNIAHMALQAGWTDYSVKHPVELNRLKLFAKLVSANDTALFQQMLALCSKDGGWTLEEAADTICEIENILLARLEDEQ